MGAVLLGSLQSSPEDNVVSLVYFALLRAGMLTRLNWATADTDIMLVVLYKDCPLASTYGDKGVDHLSSLRRDRQRLDPSMRDVNMDPGNVVRGSEVLELFHMIGTEFFHSHERHEVSDTTGFQPCEILPFRFRSTIESLHRQRHASAPQLLGL